MSPAPVALRIWMAKEAIPCKVVGHLVRVSSRQVQKYKLGIAKPSYAVRIRFEQVTGGSVAAPMWDDEEPMK